MKGPVMWCFTAPYVALKFTAPSASTGSLVANGGSDGWKECDERIRYQEGGRPGEQTAASWCHLHAVGSKLNRRPRSKHGTVCQKKWLAYRQRPNERE
jgi:hypothetical protein